MSGENDHLKVVSSKMDGPEKAKLVHDAAMDLYLALKAVLTADDNRSALKAVEQGKKAIRKAEGESDPTIN